ncbi:sodium-dependent transporter [Bacillus multifaciens]|uniref:sodium-dependent transporter n=1 Tax=Bacillus multifaciens TaxID=3068506 RepID=UPI0027413AD0|nr:sodium-dependent transporter [Bacillus sp. WLY-B-L8]MDP7980924.1 sodium-dependent transporter [Bacillus sp. WLY-B-L8]HDX9591315.1 sodium-dependent transporter [Bacillus pseudomycoides]
MKETQQWTSKIGFVLAAAGAAVGLGAIWKFPYVAGNSGGGAFFLVFLLMTIFIGMPLLVAEFVIGRSTQKEAVTAYKVLVPNGKLYPWIGRMGVVTCFSVLSFYSVVGGWILLYLFYSVTGGLWANGADYAKLFGETISNPISAIGAQFIFMLCTIFIVSKGVEKGIEKASKYMMPLLFVLFLAIIIRSLTLDGAWKGVEFFLKPDFSKLTAKTILYAMGQSFFSLTVGASVMVTYSSYLKKEEHLAKSATSITSLTVFVTVLAGLAIFPAIFALGVSPTEGPGLLFIVLPAVFGEIPFGHFFFILFLILFFFATITSAISMLEIVVASVAKEDEKKRPSASLIIGLLIFVVGIPAALSFGVLSDVKFFGKTFFDLVDFMVSNILLPFGVLAISLFVPNKMKKELLMQELEVKGTRGKTLFNIWFFLLRYIIPITVILVFLNVIGVF